MKRTGWFVCASALTLIFSAPIRAEATAPPGGVDEARSRQNALPYYVEHVFGRLPVMPDAMQTLRLMASEQIKQEAIDRLREQAAMATAHLPVVNDLADRAVSEVDKRIPQDFANVLGPEREIFTVQHSPGRVRYVFAEGRGEMIIANGRRAFRLDLSPQIAVLRVQAAVVATVAGIAEVKNVRQSLRSISASLMQRGMGGDIGAALTVFDQVQELLQVARAAGEVLHAAAMLEKLSGVWQCEPSSPEPTYSGKTVATEQLADETIGQTATHVYRETRVYAKGGVPDDVATSDSPIPFDAFKLESSTWVRVKDGLPLRNEFAPPGGLKQRTEFEYPAPVEIALPACMTKS